jgi:23S rRNA (uracil1939-C5)-methyltransferase
VQLDHQAQVGRLLPELPEFGLSLRYRPTEFTQVNAGVNRVLVKRAVDLLDPQPGERVGDLFCGIGNFALALATRGANVLGMEGSSTWSACRRQRARQSARGPAHFIAHDLYDGRRALARLGHRQASSTPRDGA